MSGVLHRGRHRILPSLLALGLLLAWLPAGPAWGDARDISAELCQAPYDAQFDDIAGSAHEDNVLCVADHGLTQGVGDGSSYAPRQNVTRGQMASFVARFLEDYHDAPLPVGDVERFDDVPRDDSAYPHSTNIHSLAEIEVVDGTASSDGRSYAPQAGVTRAQMASMIRRALAWLDDGDARNDSAPPAGAGAAFGDTAGSVHEDNIDAIAAVGIVQGFADDTYRPGEPVVRDQMASFVMRSYDYALAEALGRDDDDGGAPEPGPVAILSPTTEAPAFPISPGDEVDISFQTDRAGQYELEFRDPDPDQDGGFFLSPDDGDGEAGDWTAFEGGDASGEIDAGDTFDVTVTLPDDEEDQGVRDVRLSFTPADDETTTITQRQDAAIVVADGVVINLTQERVDFELQPAVDEADAGDALLAVGDFEETVEIVSDEETDKDGLLLSGVGEDTVLDGSIQVDGVEGITITDLTVTGYNEVGGLVGGVAAEIIGISLVDAQDVTLSELLLQGSGPDSDDIAIAVDDAVDGVQISSSSLLDNGTGARLAAEGTLTAATLEGNGLAVLLDGAAGGSLITDSDFQDSAGAVLVAGVSEVAIEGNGFDGHDDFTIHLEEDARFTGIEDNAFGDDTAEHIRFFENDYSSTDEQSFLVDNGYASVPEVVDDGDDRVIRPEEDAADGE